ncbi:hypothetical protein IW150_003592 [Coemansia sp. RSA 2607]|nr:hypothetical protein IW150_003592 [Coemansia sp. RSA 2607]
MLRSASVSRPATPCVLLALSQAARALGEDALAARALVECLCHASSLDPLALDECVRAQWFASRVEGFSRALRSLGCGGGAAVVLQVAGAQRAVPAVAEAFGRGEVDARVARMLWDPSVVEYAEYLARARGRKGFVAYSEAAADARPLMLAAFFAWLAAELEPVP